MKEITREDYGQIVKWVKDANNYAGITSHNVDGVAHCLRNNAGKVVVVVEECEDDFSDNTIYLVNEVVYAAWKTAHGYIISIID